MHSVAQSHESSQTMHPLDRARREVVSELVRPLAELLYQADKGHRGASLSDLGSDDAIGVYIAAALKALRPEARAVRVNQVQQLKAHGFAIIEGEGETVRRQARQDVAAHGGPRHFGRVAPNTCAYCKTLIVGIPATVMLTEHLKHDAHVRCAVAEVQRGKLRRLSALSFIAVAENGGQR